MTYKIRPAAHNQFGPHRVQFVECDPDVQDVAGISISRTDLERKLKALCLLNDVVLIGATHVLKSEDTYSVLRQNPRLISEGPIVFTMSQAHNSIEEMLSQKLSNPEHHNPLWTSKNPNIDKQERELRQRAKFVENHASAVMTRDISNMRKGFSQGLTFELSEENSPLRQQVSRTGIDPDSLKDKIEETDHSSRKFIHMNADSLPPSIYDRLKKHADINYHLTGSTFHNAATTLHPYEIAESGLLYERLVNIHGNQREITATMSDPGHDEGASSSVHLLGPKTPMVNDALAIRMFSDIAGGIKEDIDALDSQQLLDLREKRVTKNLREKLSLLTNNIYQSSISIGNLQDVEEARQDFEDVLLAEYREEVERRDWAQRVTNRPTALASSVGMNILGSYLLGPREGVITGSTLSATLWVMSRHFPDLIETDLLDFEREYRELLSE